ncbi:hypothetical protein ACQJBY_030604 [Aegilops geniculata]
MASASGSMRSGGGDVGAESGRDNGTDGANGAVSASLASPADDSHKILLRANVAMDAKLMVATGRSDVQQLKHPLNKEHATTMVGVMAMGNNASLAVINPLLLASASFGSWKALNVLLDRQDRRKPPMVLPTEAFIRLLMGRANGRLSTQQASDDVEEGVDQPAGDVEEGAGQTALPMVALLDGVTFEGDTVLHAVASHGDDEEFLKCATIVCDRAKHLLFAMNNKGDTPLHCAARAEKLKMVSHLIDLAKSEDRQLELLRKENNLKETVLHDAVRTGDDDIVELLMTTDSQLANNPKQGVSPLYLAILLQKNSIAYTLYQKSEGGISYSGPDGQNALHAAVLRSNGMTKKLLHWNKSLTTKGDTNGSTPLHFATTQTQREVLREVFEANLAPLYQRDNCGLFPIHMVASLGRKDYVAIFIEKCPSSATLRDSRGRTFLHVGVEQKMRNIVSFVCGNPSLAWIVNMQDKEGNTALHLAVQAKKFRIFCCLVGNPQVLLNLTNNKGQTPLDLLTIMNLEGNIRQILICAGGRHGVHYLDHIRDKYTQPPDESKINEMWKGSAQSISIIAVLITTMTFGATFALPGGYKGDDQTNGGTPTLAGRYAFTVFMMANTLAFVCSLIATIGTMYAGFPNISMSRRRIHCLAAFTFIHGSVTTLSVAFALAVYTVLAPVAPRTAIGVCIISPLVAVYNIGAALLPQVIIANSLRMRGGMVFAIKNCMAPFIAYLLIGFWQFIVIFVWLACAKGDLRQ